MAIVEYEMTNIAYAVTSIIPRIFVPKPPTNSSVFAILAPYFM